MNTPWFETGIRQVACASISGYQKYLSPHKGFFCAHRLLYGGESCSQYIKRIVAQQGLAEAIGLSKQRFQACKEANRILRANSESSYSESQDEAKKTRKNQNNCIENLDCSGCQCAGDSINLSDSLSCETPSCELPDCGHWAGLDCGSPDCSGCDCGGCSF